MWDLHLLFIQKIFMNKMIGTHLPFIQLLAKHCNTPIFRHTCSSYISDNMIISINIIEPVSEHTLTSSVPTTFYSNRNKTPFIASIKHEYFSWLYERRLSFHHSIQFRSFHIALGLITRHKTGLYIYTYIFVRA